MKRVLILTYYFPPAGGSGVQRMLKTVRYLPECGWEPVVCTVRAGAYRHLDASLWGDVPEHVSVHRTRTCEPYGGYARLVGKDEQKAVKVGVLGDAHSWREHLAQWVRANIFIPDARVGWVPFAVRKGLSLIRDERIEAILTSGPPHSVHLTGWILHWWTGTPWLADFRDPWTDINYYHELPHTACARSVDAALERKVLQSATCVSTVSPSWQRLLAQKGARRVEVIQNGFDEGDFAKKECEDTGDIFLLTHVGSMYASRNPEALWQAVSRLRQDGEAPQFRIRLVGSVDESVRQSIRKNGLDDIVEFVDYLPHDEAVREMCRSTLLLLVIEPFEQDHGMITGKLYEYLASGRPVLGIGPPEGDAARLLRETGGGVMHTPGDVLGLMKILREQYRAWERGSGQRGAPPEAVSYLSRQRQTKYLAQLLDDLLN